MEFRKGDVVSVEAVIAFATGGQIYCDTKGGSTFSVSDADAVKLVRRKFIAGDEVDTVSPEAYVRGKVVDVRGEWAWVETPSGYMASVNMEHLRMRPAEPAGETIVNGIRVPPPPPEPQAKGEVPPPSLDVVKYTVVEGDTLTGIANTFETTVAAIASRNKIADLDMIVAGQVLEIQDERIPF